MTTIEPISANIDGSENIYDYKFNFHLLTGPVTQGARINFFLMLKHASEIYPRDSKEFLAVKECFDAIENLRSTLDSAVHNENANDPYNKIANIYKLDFLER